MDIQRATQVLGALQRREETTVPSDEVRVLAAAGLVRSFDVPTQGRMSSDAERIPAVTMDVRQLGRALHAGSGGDLEATRARLRDATTELEGLLQLKALVDGLVWNDRTESYLSLTLEGRRALADLQNWGPRFPASPLDAFRARLSEYRGSLAQSIARAAWLLHHVVGLASTEVSMPFTMPDLRLASVILSQVPGDVFHVSRRFARGYAMTPWYSTRPDDQLVGAIALGSMRGDEATSARTFGELRASLQSQGFPVDDEVVMAAALVDVPAEHRATVLLRLAELRRQRSTLNPVLLTGLARSPHAIEAAIARFEEVTARMARLGYADGEPIAMAGALLASAPEPLDVLLERFHEIAKRLTSTFSPPAVGGALLATSPLDANEAFEALQECIGAVTRGNLFDLTLEIESLGLALASVTDPLDLRSALAGPPPPGAVVSQVVAPARIVGSWWLASHGRFVYRPLVRYVASHPAHVHTVPAFG